MLVATYVALLRAVNVGGTGKLPMDELRHLCEKCELARVRTYIASGNVVFETEASESEVQAQLQSAVQDYVGRSVAVSRTRRLRQQTLRLVEAHL